MEVILRAIDVYVLLVANIDPYEQKVFVILAFAIHNCHHRALLGLHFFQELGAC